MKNNAILAIDFEYTLLEFYKKLNLKENDVIIILMIRHLLKQNNTLITPDLLAIKMHLTVNEIDTILANLMQKQFISFEKSKIGLITSLHPLEQKLSELYQIEINKDSVNKLDDEKSKSIARIYDSFEKQFGRSLSPVECSLVEDWISSGYKEEDIFGALHEAIKNRLYNVKAVDRILLKWKARNEIENEGHTAINSKWNKDLNETVNIIKDKLNDDTSGGNN